MPLILGIIVWWPSHQGYWWLSLMFVAAAELALGAHSGSVAKDTIRRLPALLMAAAIAASIALLPKAASQIFLALGYVGWRFAFGRVVGNGPADLLGVFIVQAVVFEAIFLAAAISGISSALVIILVWAGCFGLAYHVLSGRDERQAGLMASVWALVAAECSWVFTTWLISYVSLGSYLIVPQATLVLTALAYSFGGIYLAHRQNRLSRARLGEYMVIGVVILAIVIAGTQWRGSV